LATLVDYALEILVVTKVYLSGKIMVIKKLKSLCLAMKTNIIN
jgi:hypothetical protein